MKILIVDDHALFREGLCHVLNALDENVCIVEAPDYERALQRASENPDLDMVLLDLSLPGKDGFAVLSSFVTQYPALPIVILSASNQRDDIQFAIDGGAVGYIPKDTSSIVMLNALRLVLSGGIYVPPEMMQKNHLNAHIEEEKPEGLTPRQQQVLNLLVKGASNKEIAKELELAEATVKMHVTSILNALGVNNRTKAAMAAEKLGLVMPSS